MLALQSGGPPVEIASAYNLNQFGSGFLHGAPATNTAWLSP